MTQPFRRRHDSNIYPTFSVAVIVVVLSSRKNNPLKFSQSRVREPRPTLPFLIVACKAAWITSGGGPITLRGGSVDFKNPPGPPPTDPSQLSYYPGRRETPSADATPLKRLPARLRDSSRLRNGERREWSPCFLLLFFSGASAPRRLLRLP